MIGTQVSEATPPSAPRLRRRNPLTRVTASHLLMVLAAVLAFATNLVVLRNHDESRSVVVASGDVPGGRALVASDLRAVEVDVDDQLFATLIPWTQAGSLVGLVTTRVIRSGSLIGPSDLVTAAASAGLRAISIPIDPEHAVGGLVIAGDRIDLIGVGAEGPRYVITDAEVLQVPGGERGSLAGVGSFYLVVAVDPASALEVAAAIRDGNIEVVRSTGATPLTAIEP